LTVLSEKKPVELNAKQQKALTALLSHATVPDAAAACSMSETTLFRFLREANFKAHYRAARAEIVEHAITQLQRDCATASKTLREVCESGDAPASARVSAAKAILDGAMKAVEAQDMAARLEVLEAGLAGEDEGDGQRKSTTKAR
jgi:DNA-binding MurR/RpiR family transcriptional regulator